MRPNFPAVLCFLGALLACLAFCPLHGRAAGAWLAEWDIEAGKAEANAGSFSYIVLFAAYFDHTDVPALPESLSGFLQKAEAKDEPAEIKSGQGMFLSVVNDRFDEAGKVALKDPALVSRLMATEESRRKHKEALIALLAKGSFIGLELDYEQVAEKDWPVLLGFAKELAKELKAVGKRLRFVLQPQKKYLLAELPPGPEYVLMAYNLFGTHSGPGPKADYDFIDRLAGWCAHLPEKPTLALATGGFAWRGKDTRQLSERQARSLAGRALARMVRDDKSGSVWFNVADNEPGINELFNPAQGVRCEVWFADGQTLSLLARHARAKGFDKVDIWRLGGNCADTLAPILEKRHD